MKYMLADLRAENAWTDEERQQLLRGVDRSHARAERPRTIPGRIPLQPVATATSVRVRDGKRLVTDGPFAETREQLGGYFLVEAKDLNEAIAIAGRIPGARKGTVEVRPVMEIAGLPNEVRAGHRLNSNDQAHSGETDR